MTKSCCSENCWHYGTFGNKDGCQQKYGGYGGWPELIEPGQNCLHPNKRQICEPILVTSLTGLCAALDGAVIMGGPSDNTLLVQMLTNSD